MNSLEFIEKEIKSDKDFIKILRRDAQLGFKWENVDIEFFEKRIAHLQQIKKIIKELRKEKPTLSECIKEWILRGYEIITREKKYIIFRHHKTYKTIEIYLVNLSYKTYEWYDAKRPINDRLNIEETQIISLDIHNLIHKTLKALEVEKNENS